MSNKELEIFELCQRLTELLGDKEAIADLKKLYEKHPEMFKDMQEVSQTIQEVVSEPEIIVDATHSNKDKEIYKAARRLDNKRMGDIVIKNKNGTNEIFHANKKNIKEFERLQKQVEAGSRFAHFLHPDLKSAWAGSKEHSPANEIIPQTQENQSIAEQIKAESKDFNTLSSNEKLALLEKNQQAIVGMQRTKDFQEQNKDYINTKQEKELKDSKNQESHIRMRKKQ